MSNRVEDLRRRFCEDTCPIFEAMLVEYQASYADYVYQTEQVSTQERRIKNLEKNFRRMQKQPYFFIQPLGESRREQAKLCLARELEDKATYLELIHNGAMIAVMEAFEKEQGFFLDFVFVSAYQKADLIQPSYQALETYLSQQVGATSLNLAVSSAFSREFLEGQGFVSLKDTNQYLKKEL